MHTYMLLEMKVHASEICQNYYEYLMGPLLMTIVTCQQGVSKYGWAVEYLKQRTREIS